MTMRLTIIACTFFGLEKYLHSTVRKLNNFSGVLFFLCIVVFGNKAHETSASWNYTFLGYTPNFFGGISLGQEGAQNTR